MSNYDDMRELVRRISGQDNVISVLRVHLDMMEDLQDAAVLSQCVFWSDKGWSEDEWFYKSHAEWHKEIGIKRSALESSISRLVSLGIVETDVRPGKHNSPTTYYRVNMDELTKMTIEYLHKQLSRTEVRYAENSKSKIRHAENNQSDMLKTTNPSVEINLSSYSSLQQNLSTEAQVLTDPIWASALTTLKQSMNGTFEAVNPRLVAVDENPHKFTVLVEKNLPGLKRTITLAVAQGVKELKLRRHVTIALVTEWPGYTPTRRVKEAHPDGTPVNPMLAVIEAAHGNH